MTDSTTLLRLLNESCKPDYLYRQLAEECTELAQAALKKVRYMKHEMPLSQKGDVEGNYLEALADVGVMWELALLALSIRDRESMHRIMQLKRELKRERMERRLREKQPESKPCDCFAAAPPADEFRKWANFWDAFWDVINEQLEHVKEAEQ